MPLNCQLITRNQYAQRLTASQKLNTVEGVLRGHDTLSNVVLDDAIEFLPAEQGGGGWDGAAPEDAGAFRGPERTRRLGLVVCRGTAVIIICPSEGMRELAENPFAAVVAAGEAAA